MEYPSLLVNGDARLSFLEIWNLGKDVFQKSSNFCQSWSQVEKFIARNGAMYNFDIQYSYLHSYISIKIIPYHSTMTSE